MVNSYKNVIFHKNKTSVNPRDHFSFKKEISLLAKLLGNLAKIMNFTNVLLIVHITSWEQKRAYTYFM